MFSHIFVGTNDVDASQKFYDAIFGAMGVGAGVPTPKGAIVYRTETGMFAVGKPINGEPASVGNGTTIGLMMKGPDMVNAWHAAGLAHGGTACEDPPGVRQSPIGDMYLAYLRDPTGNKLCAFYMMPA